MSVLGRIATILVLSIIIAAFALIVYGNAAERWPSIAYIINEWKLDASRPLPQGVVFEGRPLFAYVINAKEVGGGEYDVRIKLKDR